MHYGHPDVFDRVFHITRGGISKASRVINISEDIFSGMTALLDYLWTRFLFPLLFVFAREIWYLTLKPDLHKFVYERLIPIAFSAIWVLLLTKRNSLFCPSYQKVQGLLEVGLFLNKRSITTS